MRAAVLSGPLLQAVRAGWVVGDGESETVAAPRISPRAVPVLDFETLYEEHFAFVWRSVRRLGVPPEGLDDAVQDVFLAAYRRLGDFEGRSSAKTWLFGISLRVARTHRRTLGRKGGGEALSEILEDTRSPNPHEAAVKRQALRVLDELLEELDEEKRAVFVLAELEELTAPEIAEALELKLNTVYSRLRAARQAFEAAVERRRAREARRAR